MSLGHGGAGLPALGVDGIAAVEARRLGSKRLCGSAEQYGGYEAMDVVHGTSSGAWSQRGTVRWRMRLV